MFPRKSENFGVSSSLNDDVWHSSLDAKAYEYWYFDAISDDGREALTIAFYENFPFSPRYGLKTSAVKVPAIAFAYYRDNKPLYRIIREFSADKFRASRNEPFVQIGDCTMKFETAVYGKGYLIEINTGFQQNRRLNVRLEWLLIEADFLKSDSEKSQNWNVVAPRADVTGHIQLTNRQGKVVDSIQFRGTGYHDQRTDTRFLPTTIGHQTWGRAHFADATAVFYSHREIGATDAVTRLYLVRDDELVERRITLEEAQPTRDIFGIRYPERLTFTMENGSRLRIKQTKVIDSSYYYLRFMSEINLTLRDGKPRKTIGLTEYLDATRLNHRWLGWLADLRIVR